MNILMYSAMPLIIEAVLLAVVIAILYGAAKHERAAEKRGEKALHDSILRRERRTHDNEGYESAALTN